MAGEVGSDAMSWQECVAAFASSPSWRASRNVLLPEREKSSSLSRFFAALQDCASPEARTDATLADVVDSALRSLHEVSQRHMPSAQMLAEGFAPASRQEMLVWLLQAFDVMHFSDNLLFDTSLLLDRYYASQPPPEEGVGGAQRKLLAAVCTALKTGSPVEQLQCPLRQVVTHLGRDQVPFDAVLVAELAMLRQLRFQVSTPTAKDFLEALTTRLGCDRAASACNSLADFLLQLTLMDASLFYRHPHAILAASALTLALFTTRAPTSSFTAVLEDLSLHCPDAVNHQGLLVQCIGALHFLWVRSVSNGPEQQPQYARVLVSKFARQSLHSASSVTPPPFPPTTVPPTVQSWTHQAAQDEFDEAISLLHQSVSSEEPRWATVLSERMRGLAESSWKVRWVLARHGWNGGRFRVPPDREQLIRDLTRSSRNRSERIGAGRLSTGHAISHGSGPRSPAATTISGSSGARSPARATMSASSGTRSPATTTMSGSSGGSNSSTDVQHSHGVQPQSRQQRPRRAASWCGQRSSGRAACVITRSPSGARGVRTIRTSSRSP